MFLDFYKLREQPFGVTPDPRYLYLSETHREALASLFYGIDSDRGFQALIAEPGMGKTTLVFQLLERLQNSCRTAFLFQSQCNSLEFYRYLLGDLGLDIHDQDIVAMHYKLNEVLAREKLAGRRFVLVIDEAQNLEESVLETVRLLSDFETPRTKLLQILLVGQPQLAKKLARPALAQLRQRVAFLSRLVRFTPVETTGYIEHRLRVAGCQNGPLFTTEALAAIAEQGQGIPRNINNLCFNALSLGCALRQRKVDGQVMREVIAEMDLDSFIEKSSNQHPPIVRPGPAASLRGYPPAEVKKQRHWHRWLGAAAASVVGFIGLLAYPVRGNPVRIAVARLLTNLVSETRSLGLSRGPIGPSGPKVWPQETLSAAREPEAPPPDVAGAHGSLRVVVKPNQTLWQISHDNLGEADQEMIRVICKINPALADPDRIKPGEEIWLPLGRRSKLRPMSANLNKTRVSDSPRSKP
jgi:general secretion pathway protein A